MSCHATADATGGAINGPVSTRWICHHTFHLNIFNHFCMQKWGGTTSFIKLL